MGPTAPLQPRHAIPALATARTSSSNVEAVQAVAVETQHFHIQGAVRVAGNGNAASESNFIGVGDQA